MSVAGFRRLIFTFSLAQPGICWYSFTSSIKTKLYQGSVYLSVVCYAYQHSKKSAYTLKKFLVLFTLTFISLILFGGLARLIDFYYPPEEYIHTTLEGPGPTKIELLFSGFRSTRIIFDSLFITTIFCLCLLMFLRFGSIKDKSWNILVSSLFLTFLLGSIFVIYKFILSGFNFQIFQFFWHVIWQSFALFMGFYFILSVIFLSFFLKFRKP